MATKKVSAKTVDVEQPVKTAKATKSVTPVATEEVSAPAPKKAAAKKEKTAETTPAVVGKAVVSSTVKVTFSLPKEAAEGAETVVVLGDFNNWQEGLTLSIQADGSFEASIELEKGHAYEYRFLINGDKWENAWNAEAYKPTPFGAYNSVVTV
jgi:1,4-alpha-glucan branching enzyme